jgi:hypothetical protein
MGHYRIIVKDTAKIDFEKHKKSGNKSIINKITKIIDELRKHP